VEAPHARLVDTDRTAGRHDVRIREPVVEAVDAIGEDVGGAQPIEPALGRVGWKDRSDDVAQRGGVCGARCDIGKSRIFRPSAPTSLVYCSSRTSATMIQPLQVR
jgi:hypothetical protein